jgi:hypothetical protein
MGRSPVVPQALDYLFVASYNTQGYGGGIHGRKWSWPDQIFYWQYVRRI